MLIGWGAFLSAERAFEKGDSTEDIRLVLWPLKAILVLMLALMAARLCLQTWGYFRLIIWGGTPIGVPLIETPEQQAATEANSVDQDIHNNKPQPGKEG